MTMKDYARRTNETIREWADRVNGKPNLNKVHCIFDNSELASGQGFALCLPETGILPRYICPDCRSKMLDLKRYHFNASNRSADDAPLGTPKKGDIESTTIGVEIEEIHYNAPSYWTFKVLVERCFNVIAEDDGTVDAEFPTDKMEGANKLSKMLKKLQKYGFLEFLDHEYVGAHCHVACTNVAMARNWYHSIFLPLCRYLQAHPDEWIAEKFGRTFGSYRNPINERTDAISHSNFVNTQHSHTLEFRLPRIHTAEQYLNVVYFWREAVAMLNAIEWLENNGNNRAERKAQAATAGEAIVNIARRYFGE